MNRTVGEHRRGFRVTDYYSLYGHATAKKGYFSLYKNLHKF